MNLQITVICPYRNIGGCHESPAEQTVLFLLGPPQDESETELVMAYCVGNILSVILADWT